MQRLLTARFGPLSSSTLTQIECANSGLIEAWFDQAINAYSLNDIFTPP
ncbi:hypothetical protein [Giesbergeria anulus]|nr:hypothetical protein [Giesbergeria anulus]